MASNERELKRFIALFDLHYGYERRNGHKIALHDPRAMDLALQFADDFKPHTTILGGDMLDCGAVSHHNKNKPGRTEGLRIVSDAHQLSTDFIKHLPSSQLVYIVGNHERWLEDVTDDLPGLEGLLDIQQLLQLPTNSVIVPQGGHYQLGKLTFVHGDQISGGEHVAKSAVITYEKSIRFGHHHTYQVYTKTSPVDNKFGKTGMACPCLCRKDPHYGRGKPNRWMQGINYGYIFPDGTYSDSVALIMDGRMVINGKVYRSP